MVVGSGKEEIPGVPHQQDIQEDHYDLGGTQPKRDQPRQSSWVLSRLPIGGRDSGAFRTLWEFANRRAKTLSCPVEGLLSWDQSKEKCFIPIFGTFLSLASACLKYKLHIILLKKFYTKHLYFKAHSKLICILRQRK